MKQVLIAVLAVLCFSLVASAGVKLQCDPAPLDSGEHWTSGKFIDDNGTPEPEDDSIKGIRAKDNAPPGTSGDGRADTIEGPDGYHYHWNALTMRYEIDMDWPDPPPPPHLEGSYIEIGGDGSPDSPMTWHSGPGCHETGTVHCPG